MALSQTTAYQASADQAESNRKPTATIMVLVDCPTHTGYGATTFFYKCYIYAQYVSLLQTHIHPSELRNSAHRSTTMLQSISSYINALIKCKLRSSMLQIFNTNFCILVRQIQLFALWFTGQGISHYVALVFSIHYHNGQLIHPLKPVCLISP